MTAIAALIGVGLGLGVVIIMQRNGMLAERSGAAILLAAVAFFYPVFAVMTGDVWQMVIHIAIFLAFAALSVRAFHLGLNLIAGGLIAHGLFDLALMAIGAPGPVWWPVFCAGVDIAAGVTILRLIQTGKVAT